MKRLTLLRHAKSSWRDTTLADRDRPLSERGERDAPAMGARLLARKARPSLIISSPAKRALATARIVARSLGYPQEFLHIDRELYLAEAAEILALIGAQDDTFSDILLVGHNPGLTDLVNGLLPGMQLNNIPTCGVVSIEIATRWWAETGTAAATLGYYDYPRNPELLISED
jgi:phosphohistidine phosphatase